MNSLRAFVICALVVWLFIDGLFVFRNRTPPETRRDRLSMLGIILAVWVGIGIAIPVGYSGIGSLGSRTPTMQIAGLAILAIGITIRSVAIAQLGRFHAPVVAIQEGHRVVDTGLYRFVRHPSYLGGAIAMLGFGLGLGSWVSAVIVAGLTLLAYAYRIHVEEQALVASLGDAYVNYSKRTSRLIPGVY